MVLNTYGKSLYIHHVICSNIYFEFSLVYRYWPERADFKITRYTTSYMHGIIFYPLSILLRILDLHK